MKNFFVLFYYIFTKKISWSDFVNIQKDSNIGEKVKFIGLHKVINSSIGDYTYISKNSNISYAKIGKYCSIDRLNMRLGIHPTNGLSTSPMFYSVSKQNGFSVTNKNKIEERKIIEIGNDVFIGANVTILDGVKIGDGAIIGAGAVVSKDIPAYAIAAGSPIRILKYRFDEKTIKSLLNINWWNADEKIHEVIENHFFDIDSFLNLYEK